MSRDKKQRFRITTWPGSALPVPTVSSPAPIYVRGQNFCFTSEDIGVSRLPHDFVLGELTELEVDDDAALRLFVEAFGLPSAGRSRRRELDPPWVTEYCYRRDDVRECLRLMQDLVAFWVAFSWKDAKYAAILEPHLQPLVTTSSVDDLLGEASDPVQVTKQANWITDPPPPPTNDEMQAFEEERSARAAKRRPSSWGVHMPVDVSRSRPPDLYRRAWEFFLAHLNHGLRSIPPRVFVSDYDKWINSGSEEVDLIEACCIQLANLVAAQSDVHRCANETCCRMFTQQRGRAEHGQYRSSGVKYCSTNCARSQAQREYRRRKGAAEKQP